MAHKLALVGELARNYDIDGLELDFMRYPRLFADDMPAPERRRIVEGFIGGVRAALDARRKGRELALRVPPKLGAFAPLGIEPSRLGALGVDRLNLSSNTFTNQDIDFDAIWAAATGLRLTLEMAYAKHFLMHQAARRPDAFRSARRRHDHRVGGPRFAPLNWRVRRTAPKALRPPASRGCSAASGRRRHGKTLSRSYDAASGKSALHMVSAWSCEDLDRLPD